MKEKYLVEPRIEHYGPMLGAFGWDRHLDEACGMIKGIKDC